jgi:hypothetical protein
MMGVVCGDVEASLGEEIRGTLRLVRECCHVLELRTTFVKRKLDRYSCKCGDSALMNEYNVCEVVSHVRSDGGIVVRIKVHDITYSWSFKT